MLSSRKRDCILQWFNSLNEKWGVQSLKEFTDGLLFYQIIVSLFPDLKKECTASYRSKDLTNGVKLEADQYTNDTNFVHSSAEAEYKLGHSSVTNPPSSTTEETVSSNLRSRGSVDGPTEICNGSSVEINGEGAVDLGGIPGRSADEIFPERADESSDTIICNGSVDLSAEPTVNEDEVIKDFGNDSLLGETLKDPNRIPELRDDACSKGASSYEDHDDIATMTCASDTLIKIEPADSDDVPSVFVAPHDRLKSIDMVKRYEAIKKFIEGILGLESEELVNFSECMKGVELELAKFAVLFLSALLQNYLSSDNTAGYRTICQINHEVQEEIKECAELFLTERTIPVTKKEFHNIMAHTAKPRCSPRRNISLSCTPQQKKSKPPKGKRNRTNRKVQIIEEEIIESPLKSFLESPDIRHITPNTKRAVVQHAVSSKNKEISELVVDLDEKSDLIRDLQKDKDNLRTEMFKLEEEKRRLKEKQDEERRGFEDEREHYERQRKELEDETERLRQQIRMLESDLQYLRVENVSSTSIVETSNTVEESPGHSDVEILSHNTIIELRDEKIKELENRIDRMSIELREYEALKAMCAYQSVEPPSSYQNEQPLIDVSKIKKEIVDYEYERVPLEKQNEKELSEQQNDTEPLEQQNEKELSEQQDDTELLKQQNEKELLEKQNKCLEEEIQSLKKQVEGLDADLKVLRGEGEPTAPTEETSGEGEKTVEVPLDETEQQIWMNQKLQIREGKIKDLEDKVDRMTAELKEYEALKIVCSEQIQDPERHQEVLDLLLQCKEQKSCNIVDLAERHKLQDEIDEIENNRNKILDDFDKYKESAKKKIKELQKDLLEAKAKETSWRKQCCEADKKRENEVLNLMKQQNAQFNEWMAKKDAYDRSVMSNASYSEYNALNSSAAPLAVADQDSALGRSVKSACVLENSAQLWSNFINNDSQLQAVKQTPPNLQSTQNECTASHRFSDMLRTRSSSKLSSQTPKMDAVVHSSTQTSPNSQSVANKFTDPAHLSDVNHAPELSYPLPRQSRRKLSNNIDHTAAGMSQTETNSRLLCTEAEFCEIKSLVIDLIKDIRSKNNLKKEDLSNLVKCESTFNSLGELVNVLKLIFKVIKTVFDPSLPPASSLKRKRASDSGRFDTSLGYPKELKKSRSASGVRQPENTEPLQNEFGQMQVDIANLQKENQVLKENLLENIAELTKELKALEMENKVLQKELTKAEHVSNSNLERAQKISREKLVLIKEKKEYEKEREALKNLVKIKSVCKSCELLKKNITLFNKEKSHLKKTIFSLEKNLKSKEHEANDVNQQLVNLQRKVKTLEEDLEKEKQWNSGNFDSILLKTSEGLRDKASKIQEANRNHLEFEDEWQDNEIPCYKNVSLVPPFNAIDSSYVVKYHHSGENKNKLSVFCKAEDEAEMLSQSSIAEIHSETPSKRMLEIQRRNSQYLPHLKSAYPLELNTTATQHKYFKSPTPVQPTASTSGWSQNWKGPETSRGHDSGDETCKSKRASLKKHKMTNSTFEAASRSASNLFKFYHSSTPKQENSSLPMKFKVMRKSNRP